MYATKRTLVNSISYFFYDQAPWKSDWCPKFLRVRNCCHCVELNGGVKGKNAFHSQFTYKLQRNLETWFTLPRKQTQFILRKKNSLEKLSKTIVSTNYAKTNDLIIFLCLIFLLPWKFCPKLVGKLTSFAFLVYVWFCFTKRER